jgi:hypothetical protein
MTDEFHTQSHGERVGLGVETSDVNFRAILMFLVALTVVAILVHLALWLLFGLFEGQLAKSDPKAPAIVNEMTQRRENQKKSGLEALAQGPGHVNLPRDINERQQIEESLRTTFPEPRLQYDDVKDVTDMRRMENEKLNNYGWADQQRGIVRIPIQRAMQILAERGLPSGSAPPPAPPGGKMVQGSRESSHSRKYGGNQ